MYIHEYMYMYTSSCMWFVVVPEAYKNLVAISQTLILLTSTVLVAKVKANVSFSQCIGNPCLRMHVHSIPLLTRPLVSPLLGRQIFGCVSSHGVP